jgi:hypothetical protein
MRLAPCGCRRGDAGLGSGPRSRQVAIGAPSRRFCPPLVETNPICRRDAGQARAGAGTGGVAPQVNCAKQTQFHQGGTRDKYFAGKELWLIGHARGPGKTKPICTGVASLKLESPPWSLWSIPASHSRRAARGAVARAKCAKRTQNAADGQGRPSPRPQALTLPPGRGNRAKQSQFVPERNGRQVVCRKRVMVNWTCQGPGKNKANFGAEGRGQGPAGLPALRVGLVVQTNPICCRRAWKTIPKAGGLEAATPQGQSRQTRRPRQKSGRQEICGKSLCCMDLRGFWA